MLFFTTDLKGGFYIRNLIKLSVALLSYCKITNNLIAVLIYYNVEYQCWFDLIYFLKMMQHPSTLKWINIVKYGNHDNLLN